MRFYQVNSLKVKDKQMDSETLIKTKNVVTIDELEPFLSPELREKLKPCVEMMQLFDLSSTFKPLKVELEDLGEGVDKSMVQTEMKVQSNQGFFSHLTGWLGSKPTPKTLTEFQVTVERLITNLVKDLQKDQTILPMVTFQAGFFIATEVFDLANQRKYFQNSKTHCYRSDDIRFSWELLYVSKFFVDTFQNFKKARHFWVVVPVYLRLFK